MKFSRDEIIVYAIIAIIVIAVVAYFASTLLSHTVSVSVRMAQVGTSPSSLYPYNVANLKATINNTGSASISGLVLVTYVNGQKLNSYTVALPPKTSESVNITYVYPFNGTYQFEAVADPGHLVNIANRSAASASFTYKVNQPQVPNVYSSVPNSNITDTHRVCNKS